MEKGQYPRSPKKQIQETSTFREQVILLV